MQQTRKTRFLVIALVLAAVLFCLWYTRPRSIRDLTGNQPVVSIEICRRTYSGEIGAAADNSSFFTQNPEAITAILGTLEDGRFNSKIDWAALLGAGSGRHLPAGRDGLVDFSLNISYQAKPGTLRMMTLEIESPGRLWVDGHPFGMGRFGYGQARQYCEKLEQLFNATGEDPRWSVYRDGI